MLQDKVLRRIFAPRRPEEPGGWKKLGNKKDHKFYASPRFITLIK
jgi:hypothetical protein